MLYQRLSEAYGTLDMRGSKVKALRRWWVKQVTDLKIPPGGASWRATKWLVDRCGWPKGAKRIKKSYPVTGAGDHIAGADKMVNDK